MSESFWRAKAQAVIRETIARVGTEDRERLALELRDAYPFGERKHHPYKIWLDECRRQMGGLSRSRLSSFGRSPLGLEDQEERRDRHRTWKGYGCTPADVKPGRRFANADGKLREVLLVDEANGIVKFSEWGSKAKLRPITIESFCQWVGQKGGPAETWQPPNLATLVSFRAAVYRRNLGWWPIAQEVKP